MQNIAHMRKQMRSLGFGMDWSREFATCDPAYYHWEQWFFVKLFEKGLVYRKSAIVNWDPVDQTVLANEQVVDGRGWRSGAVVERREMQQWFAKITDYADELLDELDVMDGWPDSVKNMQRNWIGRSQGVEIDFPLTEPIPAMDPALRVYTTRPDTLLGATYVAVAAEHPLAKHAADQSSDVAAFVESCKNVKAVEAEIATLEKAGIETSITVNHPLTGESLPVWVANFVLMEYGSGAVMAVPGHDQRDWEFAHKYGIEIKQVIEAVADETCDLKAAAFTEHGRLVNSGAFDGLEFDAAFDAIADALADKGLGSRKTNYRLRDWGVSRQRYWGCPIPIIHCDSCGVVPVPERDLPVLLPTEVEFEGVQSPLKTMDSFLQVKCPTCGAGAKRETDTFDTFMESSWYHTRFTSPDANSPMVDSRVDFWAPVDFYVGGIEHAILHLLYARFYHKLMRDAGLLDSSEPFTSLLMIGMVLQDGKKMSKSSGDAGDPQHLIEKYGADAVRTAMMFAAPPDQSFEWNEAGVEGAARFQRKLWTLVMDSEPGSAAEIDPAQLSSEARALRRKTHETISRADDDYSRRIQFNTVVSGVMELVNEISRFKVNSDQDRAVVDEALRSAVLVISPIAPHMAHVLWRKLKQNESAMLVNESWPDVDAGALVQDTVQVVVQVNGKVRGRIEISADSPEAEVKEAALKEENVARFVAEKEIAKVIYVKGKLVNVVAR
jgi:leucyl-tRNA synthetase